MIFEGLAVDVRVFFSFSTEYYDYMTISLVGQHEYSKLPDLFGMGFYVLFRSRSGNVL